MYKPRLCHKRNLKIVVNREVFFKSEHHTNQSCAESLQKKIKHENSRHCISLRSSLEGAERQAARVGPLLSYVNQDDQ